jgi:competence protein ComEC
MSGVLFGGSGGLSEDLKGDFSRTGLSHVMAASGYNVSIFSQLLLVFLMRSTLGRKRALIVSGLLVIVYIFLAGATPPVVRAGIMAATVMLGTWLGRTPHSGNLLLLSGGLMLFVSPRLVSGVGFQLSFASTAGLMLFASWFGERINFIPKIFGLRESVSASLAAIAATLPIMLWHFGSISAIAPLVNLLVLPWIPYLMLLGGVALGLSWLSITLGMIAAIPGAALSFFVLLLVNWFGSVSFAAIVLPKVLSAILALVFFVLLLGIVRKKNKDKVPSSPSAL